MRLIRYLSLSTLFLIGFCYISGCVSMPPASDASDEETQKVMVGTPGSVAFPDAKPANTDEDVVLPSAPAVDTAGGCNRDTQCKGDRVCVAGNCVSPQYAEAYEAQFLSETGMTPEPEKPENSAIIEVKVPPSSNRKLSCRKKQVNQCMSKCDKGDMDSCYSAGRIYETSPKRVDAVNFAVYAYSKACDGGDALSCLYLSRMYFNGDLLTRNLDMAFILNLRGCELKNMYACINAAVFLENGIGVEKDAEQAATRFTEACILGDDQSCTKATPTDELPTDPDVVGAPVETDE